MPIGGIDPTTSILQAALDEARLHGGHGGGKRIRQQPQANDAAELTKEASARPRASFTQLVREATKTEDPEEANKDEPSAQDDQQPDSKSEHNGQPHGREQERERDPEAEADAVLAEWQAMHPGGL
ncbi:MAG: hypothetical protein JO247_16645 [Chloroflexi bacterium]|nr:hypothetical protein [Chloroflexota bacterium]